VVASIRWQAADTTVTVDSLSGLVTAISGSGSGRVQASVGTLRSAILTFTLTTAAGVRD
jgi:hypothetical protein